MTRFILLLFCISSSILISAQDEFITKWTIGKDPNITIPHNPDPSFVYDYLVDWGDGSPAETVVTVDSAASHTYDTTGTFTVKISGTFPAIHLNNTSDATKLSAIEQWGNIDWKSMNRAFAGATYMTYNATDLPDLNDVTDYFYMFEDAVLFNGAIGNWDVSKGTTMHGMFHGATSFDQPLNDWDVGEVTTMFRMFSGASSFNQSLSDWTVSKVSNMFAMFYNASSFNQSLADWDVDQVTDMISMLDFSGLSRSNYDYTLIGWASPSLPPGRTLGVEGLKYCDGNSARNALILLGWIILGDSFNCSGDIPFVTTWNTTQSGESITIHTSPEYAYDYDVDWDNDGIIDDFDLSSDITHAFTSPGPHKVSIYGIFPHFRAQTDLNYNVQLIDINSWGNIEWQSMTNSFYRSTNLEYSATDFPDLSRVTDLDQTFSECSNFNGDIGGWDVSNVTSMKFTFGRAILFNQKLGEWDVDAVKNMNGLFSVATSFNQPLEEWVVSSVDSMYSMFNGATSFDQPLENWDVSNVTNMGAMFAGTTSFNQKLEGWDVSNVQNMSFMFAGGTGFAGVPLFNHPLEKWDVSSVQDMRWMFSGNTIFNQPLEKWDVSNVTDMGGMFTGSIFNHPLNGWTVTSLESMWLMFSGNTSFNQPLNNWDVSNLVTLRFTFHNASSFNQPLDNWKTSNVLTLRSTFEGATSFNQPLDEWETSNVTSMRNTFNGATSFDQPLDNWNVEMVDDMEFMLSGSALSTTNYDHTLIAWETQNIMNDVILDADGLTYCNGAESRQKLIDNHGWMISDDTEDCSNVGPCTTPATNIFIGDSDNHWNVPSNWSQGRIPDECDEVIIALDRLAILSGDAFCYTLEIQAGGMIDVDGHELTVSAMLPNGN